MSGEELFHRQVKGMALWPQKAISSPNLKANIGSDCFDFGDSDRIDGEFRGEHSVNA